MNKKSIKIIGSIILFIIIISINHSVFGANATINAPESVYVGDSITVTIKGNAASWSGLTLAASGQISGSGGIMANVTDSGENENVTMGTYTFKATEKGQAKFELSGTVADADYSSKKISTSKIVTIKEKEQPKVETPPAETKPTTPTTTETKTTTKTTGTKATNSTTTTPKKTETKTTETPKAETQEQPQEDNFYINSITVKGLKETGEQVDIALSPEFSKDIYEYTCSVSADIQRLDIQKDAGEYTNSVVVAGTEELKEGENTIILRLLAEDHQAKTYTIKAVKEQKEQVEEVAETSAQVEEKEEEQIENKEEGKKMISMPVGTFILMQIAIIAIEILIIKCVPWSKIGKIRKH